VTKDRIGIPKVSMHCSMSVAQPVPTRTALQTMPVSDWSAKAERKCEMSTLHYLDVRKTRPYEQG